MYLWFARKSSVAVWINRALLVLALVVMVSQLTGKTALAQETEQRPSTAQKQTPSPPPRHPPPALPVGKRHPRP